MDETIRTYRDIAEKTEPLRISSIMYFDQATDYLENLLLDARLRDSKRYYPYDRGFLRLPKVDKRNLFQFRARKEMQSPN